MDFTSLVGRRFFGMTPLTVQETQALPPVCKLVLTNWKEKFWVSVLDGSPLLDRPEYNMAKDANWMHHYCAGLLGKYRYLASSDVKNSGNFMVMWRSSMEYCIRGSDNYNRTWPYRNILYHEIALSYFMEKRYEAAINNIEKSLNENDKYAPAYSVAADSYQALRMNGQAKMILEKGLHKIPTSTALSRRYSEMGGDPSKIILEATIESKDHETLKIPKKILPNTGTSVQATPTTHPMNQEITSTPEPRPTKSGKSYCRFCPTETGQ